MRRFASLALLSVATASHDSAPVCSSPALGEFCYFDPCPVGEPASTCQFGPGCADGACACGGVIVVGYGGAEGVINAFGGVTSTCLLSAAGCPQSPLPPTAVQPAVATLYGRAADGTRSEAPIPTCATAVSPSLNPAQCRANGAATKAFLELPTTLNSNGETYLVPCPRTTSPFTAADYNGWLAHHFPSVGGATTDPHFTFAHGGRADIRGEPDAVFNLLSHRNVSMNVKFEKADFHWNKRTVHGTRLSAAYWTLRTVAGKEVTVSVDALNSTAAHKALGQLAVVKEGGVVVPFSEDQPFASANVAVKITGRKVTVTNGAWEMAAHVSPFPFAQLNKGQVLLNVAIKPLVDVENDAVAPHGLIGQSWDGDEVDFDGAVDTDRSVETTTKAQGEGAIEGSLDEYKMSGPHATAFKYARFDARRAARRDASKLTGTRRPKATRGTVGSSSAPTDMVA